MTFLLWLAVGLGVCAGAPPVPTKDNATQVVFDVAVPLETKADAELWISGNHPALGDWNGTGVKLSRSPDGRYSATVPLPPGHKLEYKVTRGTWATVEKDVSGQEIRNRTLRVGGESPQTVALTVARWADQRTAPAQRTLTGNIRYLRDVASAFLPRKRDIIVWLPPDYEESKRRYPVLYMHDGQNLMDSATAHAGEWRVDETAQQLVQSGEVEPLIIIGIYNTEDRFAEYTQVKDTGQFAKYDGGNADAYGRFLVEELKPMIDRTFRTKPQPQDTGLAGSSLGGLVTLHLGIKYPTTFRRLGVVSPSVFWAEKEILERVKALKKKQPLKIWVDIGTQESLASQETVEDTRLLRDALVAEGWQLDKDLRYMEIQGAGHSESAWADRFDDILRYLYPATGRR